MSSINLTPLPWQQKQWQRLLQQEALQRLAHAYLLVGERGLGKLRFARAAGQFLLCHGPTTGGACGQCRSCALFASESNPDLLSVGPVDSRVIKIDQVRELTEFAARTGHSNNRKVIILHHAEALNANAANALLKTLEEPPGQTVLLLVSDNPGRLLATIRSRCQRVLFNAPDSQMAVDWLLAEIPDLTDSDELQDLLALVNHSPLQAQQMLSSDTREQHGNVLAAFSAMLEGRLDPVEFATSAKTLGVENILTWLWQTSTLVIKYWISKDRQFTDDDKIAVLCNRLQRSSRSADEILTRLLSMNQAVNEARRQLEGPSNPNPQLLLEGIFWRWSRLAS